MKYLAQHLAYRECSVNAWGTKNRSRGSFQATGIPGVISKVKIYPWLLGREKNCIASEAPGLIRTPGACASRGAEAWEHWGKGLVSPVGVRSETPLQLLQCEKCQEPDVEAR